MNPEFFSLRNLKNRLALLLIRLGRPIAVLLAVIIIILLSCVFLAVVVLVIAISTLPGILLAKGLGWL